MPLKKTWKSLNKNSDLKADGMDECRNLGEEIKSRASEKYWFDKGHGFEP
jgi:hypothetical protein